MSQRNLTYRCKSRRYVLPEGSKPFDGKVEGFRLREEVEPDRTQGAPNEAVSYRIVAERPVSSTDEVQEAVGIMLDLADDLDRLWIYVTGAPLFYLQRVFEELLAPDHWQGNAREVREKLRIEEQGSTLTAKVGFGNVSTRGIPYFPLREALNLRQRYQSSDDRLIHLIDLHHEALTTAGIHARLMVFAKAIELVDAMVEGEKPKKEKFLPSATGSDLCRRFEWLFDVGNNRLDIRHVVTKSDGTLHDPLTTQERRDYMHDADIVIRDVVCTRLGREPFRVEYRS